MSAKMEISCSDPKFTTAAGRFWVTVQDACALYCLARRVGCRPDTDGNGTPPRAPAGPMVQAGAAIIFFGVIAVNRVACDETLWYQKQWNRVVTHDLIRPARIGVIVSVLSAGLVDGAEAGAADALASVSVEPGRSSCVSSLRGFDAIHSPSLMTSSARTSRDCGIVRPSRYPFNSFFSSLRKRQSSFMRSE